MRRHAACSARDGGQWWRPLGAGRGAPAEVSSGGERGGSAVCASILLLGGQTDGQTVPLPNGPAAAPREVQMLGDILNRSPFARGAGDTEALLLSSQAGSSGVAPRRVGKDGERLGRRAEVPAGSWSRFLEDESFLREGNRRQRKNPSGWRNLWVRLCDPQRVIQLRSRH